MALGAAAGRSQSLRWRSGKMETLAVPAGAEELPVAAEMVLSGLAILGSVYVLFTYFFFEGERNLRRRLLSYVALAKLLTNAVTVGGRVLQPEGGLCAAFGSVYIVGELSGVLWMAVVVAHAYSQQRVGGGVSEAWYHLCVWGSIAAVVIGMFVLFGAPADLFPERRELFEQGCSLATSQTLARSVCLGLPTALGVHYTAVRYYFHNKHAVEAATDVHLTQEQKGQGYMLGAEEMKVRLPCFRSVWSPCFWSIF